MSKKCLNSPDEKSDYLLTFQVKSSQEGEVGKSVAPDIIQFVIGE